MIGVEYLYNQTGEILKDNTVEEEDLRHGEEALSDINRDQIDEGFDEDEDETIALAEQVFTLPLGSDRGRCTFSPNSDFPESLTKNVNLHLDSDATSTSDEDSAELVGGDSSCATEVSFLEVAFKVSESKLLTITIYWSIGLFWARQHSGIWRSLGFSIISGFYQRGKYGLVQFPSQ